MNRFSNYLTHHFLLTIFLIVFSIVFTTFVHEVGHFIWYTLVFKVPTSIVIDTKTLIFHAFGYLPPERFREVRENTDWYLINLRLTAFMGNLQIIPIIEFGLLFPDLVIWSYFLFIFETGYSFYETFIKDHRKSEWIIETFQTN